ncbi:MAG: hypothetical protein IPK60_25000 [Sandaracinaceae bacterium]|jgi:hypothetical protein|nr:hypothetical protein [Sandaracinaceae bacterium]
MPSLAPSSFALLTLLMASAACSNNAEPPYQEPLDAGVDSDTQDTDASIDIDAGDVIDLGYDAGWIDDPRQMPRDIRRVASDLEVARENNRVKIYLQPGSTLTEEQIVDYFDTATAAVTFNLDEMDTPSEEIEPRVRVVVLDETTYAAVTGSNDTYGLSYIAFGSDGDAFVIPYNALEDRAEMDDTIAHEVNHILVSRRVLDDSSIPWWQVEGTAINMGSHFGWEVDHTWTGFLKRYVDPATGADATLTFARFDVEDMTANNDELAHDQAVAGFFIEYLRFLHPHGGEMGYPDVHGRMLAVSTEASRGADFDEAFAANFGGLSLADAKTAYAAYLQSTVTGSTRYVGTIFE